MAGWDLIGRQTAYNHARSNKERPRKRIRGWTAGHRVNDVKSSTRRKLSGRRSHVGEAVGTGQSRVQKDPQGHLRGEVQTAAEQWFWGDLSIEDWCRRIYLSWHVDCLNSASFKSDQRLPQAVYRLTLNTCQEKTWFETTELRMIDGLWASRRTIPPAL